MPASAGTESASSMAARNTPQAHTLRRTTLVPGEGEFRETAHGVKAVSNMVWNSTGKYIPENNVSRRSLSSA